MPVQCHQMRKNHPERNSDWTPCELHPALRPSSHGVILHDRLLAPVAVRLINGPPFRFGTSQTYGRPIKFFCQFVRHTNMELFPISLVIMVFTIVSSSICSVRAMFLLPECLSNWTTFVILSTFSPFGIFVLGASFI